MTPEALDQWRWEKASNCMSPLDAIESYRRLVREDVRPARHWNDEEKCWEAPKPETAEPVADKIAKKIGPLTLNLRRGESYGGEHREWDEPITILRGSPFLSKVIEAALPYITRPQQTEVVEALERAKALLDCVEQTSGNVWFVNADDPEDAVCKTYSAIESALKGSRP